MHIYIHCIQILIINNMLLLSETTTLAEITHFSLVRCVPTSATRLWCRRTTTMEQSDLGFSLYSIQTGADKFLFGQWNHSTGWRSLTIQAVNTLHTYCKMQRIQTICVNSNVCLWVVTWMKNTCFSKCFILPSLTPHSNHRIKWQVYQNTNNGTMVCRRLITIRKCANHFIYICVKKFFFWTSSPQKPLQQ